MQCFQYYDTVEDAHKEILLDVSPLPVCDNKVLAAYISFLLQVRHTKITLRLIH